MGDRLWTQQIVVDEGAVRGSGRLDLDQETGCVKSALFGVQGLQRFPGTHKVETGRRNESALLDDDILADGVAGDQSQVRTGRPSEIVLGLPTSPVEDRTD